MKKIYFLLASLIIALILCFSSPFQSVAYASNPNDEQVEYVCIDGKWYIIIHTDTGDIQMNGIGHPPQNL